MGTDAQAKKYFSNPVIMADLGTNTLFHGAIKVDPASLTQLDPTAVETEVLQKGEKLEMAALQRYDDILYRLQLPEGSLLGSKESKRLSDLARILCEAMKDPDQTWDTTQSSADETQASENMGQSSEAAGQLPCTEVDMDDLFEDSGTLFREFSFMILPFLLMFLPEDMEDEFKEIEPQKCEKALLGNVTNALMKAMQKAFLRALEEMEKQL